MCTATLNGYPRLLADIGGTNARFALQTAPEQWERISVLPCADYATLNDAVTAYLREYAHGETVRHAAFAIANPIRGDWVQMTNHHWAFSIEAVRQAFAWETLLLLNDFTAQALAVSRTEAHHLVQVGGGKAAADAPKAVIGAGTGLGVSGLIPSAAGWTALAGEGGHVSFSPFDDTEVMIWQYARQQFGHVSVERLLSGAGLVLIYQALAQQHAHSVPLDWSPADITSQALNGTSPLCRETLDIFCAMLGTAASNLVLTLGARGGVYVCGGIVPRFADYFKQSPFRRRFEDKGRFADYLADVPAYVVLSPYPGIEGAAVALHNHLRLNIKELKQ